MDCLADEVLHREQGVQGAMAFAEATLHHCPHVVALHILGRAVLHDVIL
jgi:hypothetical protein